MNEPTNDANNPATNDTDRNGDRPDAAPDTGTGDPSGADYVDPGCDYCLGGFTPVGTHRILGAVYQTCTGCREHCRCCDNAGLFPADTTCMHCLTDALAAYGLVPVFCHTCAGVIDIRPDGALL